MLMDVLSHLYLLLVIILDLVKMSPFSLIIMSTDENIEDY